MSHKHDTPEGNALSTFFRKKSIALRQAMDGSPGNKLKKSPAGFRQTL
ncbi:hypothetical protein LZZ85_04175 [Terrimonas sp. NA20]|uniref:Uncharacterized protein n=1 Tax=Terrimonas ginsenosidimutans TaxID=2908004 RepID=A0ABS9KMA8_9BACT|nr:hypothetical protein [Terrimonas ginsenosidimutans]MCG2613460.1 hypothetical protein [Terrimonas ginsenosidimutans]